MLKAVTNKYGGVFVSGDDLPDTPAAFEAALEKSVEAWESRGAKLAWIQVPPGRTTLLSVALARGFEFHHCQRDELMLVKRILPDAYIPLASTHTIGVGAVVLSETRELLTVLEQRDVTARPGYFKLPGGMLEEGEHLADGAVREVREETGVRAEFQGLLSLRHHHRGQFGASNIYAVCVLRPLSFEITIDESEIGKAQWTPADEYLASEEVGLYNKRVVQAALSSRPLSSIKIDGYMDRPDDYEVYCPDSDD